MERHIDKWTFKKGQIVNGMTPWQGIDTKNGMELSFLS
jgi:hypothetical protein